MKIEQIKENFQIDVGAPEPRILCNEFNLYLIFYKSNIDPGWDGKTVHIRNKEDKGIVTIKFNKYAQFKFGNPNDESIYGHPYYDLGLKPYAIQKVLNSNWIKELIKMNSVHPYHKDELFADYQHFIFFFQDRCFEIVAEGYSINENSKKTMKAELLRIVELI